MEAVTMASSLLLLQFCQPPSHLVEDQINPEACHSFYLLYAYCVMLIHAEDMKNMEYEKAASQGNPMHQLAPLHRNSMAEFLVVANGDNRADG